MTSKAKAGFREVMAKYKMVDMEVGGSFELPPEDLPLVRSATQFLHRNLHGRWAVRTNYDGSHTCTRVEAASERALDIDPPSKRGTFIPEGRLTSTPIPKPQGAIMMYGMRDMQPGDAVRVSEPCANSVRGAIELMRDHYGREGFELNVHPHDSGYFLLTYNGKRNTGE